MLHDGLHTVKWPPRTCTEASLKDDLIFTKHRMQLPTDGLRMCAEEQATATSVYHDNLLGIFE